MTTTSFSLATAIVMAAALGPWGSFATSVRGLPSPRSHSVRVLKGPRCGRCQLLHLMSCSIKSSTPACRRWCRPSLSNGSSGTGSTLSVVPCTRPRSQLPADRTRLRGPAKPTAPYASGCITKAGASQRAPAQSTVTQLRAPRPQQAWLPTARVLARLPNSAATGFQTIGGSIGAQPHSRSERHSRPGAPTSPLPTRQC
jgi:hypothetical protein